MIGTSERGGSGWVRMWLGACRKEKIRRYGIGGKKVGKKDDTAINPLG